MKMNKITRKSFLKVFAATMVGGAAASALTGATAPVSIDETNGKVSRWVKNNLNPDGPLTIAKQGMFSSGGTVTAPVAGTYDATTTGWTLPVQATPLMWITLISPPPALHRA